MRYPGEDVKLVSVIDAGKRIPERAKSVRLVRGVREKDALKLLELGIKTYEQLAEAGPDYLKKKLKWTDKKTGSIVLHAKARAMGKPIIKKPHTFPKGVIYFYDIETLGRVTYLHGVLRLDGNDLEERSFLAERPSDEGVAWRSFLEFLAQDNVGAQCAAPNKEAIIYSWTDFERRFIHNLWDTYGGDRQGWKLLRENLSDQCALVKNHFALPVRTYSIKEVAPTFGFQWTTPGANGLKCQSWYKRWLQTADKNTLKRILTYNLDDVRAMYVIHKELSRL